MMPMATAVATGVRVVLVGGRDVPFCQLQECGPAAGLVSGTGLGHGCRTTRSDEGDGHRLAG